MNNFLFTKSTCYVITYVIIRKEFVIKPQKINKTNLSDEVFNQLINMIKDGSLVEGEKIPSESDLVSDFGVSRVSVRSAIDKLRGQGVLETYHGKGSFVSEDALAIINNSFNPKIIVSKDEYLDVIQFRRAIELTAIELVCKHGKDEDIQKINNALKKMKQSIADYVAYTDADLDFHTNIINAAGNKIFISIFNQNRKIFRNYLLTQNIKAENNFEYSITNHQKIYAAIEKRDSDEAIRLISNSYERNKARLFKE